MRHAGEIGSSAVIIFHKSDASGLERLRTLWVFKRLKKLHLLERDRKTGLRKIDKRVFGLMDLWEGPEFRPDRRFRAFDPGYQRACSKDSGCASSFLKALGRDCSGLAAPAIERTRKYESDLEHTRISNEYRQVKAEEVVREVKDKRCSA